MITNIQDFEDHIGQDLYELKSELRLSLNPEQELSDFLEHYAPNIEAEFLDELTEELELSISRLDETVVERLTSQQSKHDAYEYEPDTSHPTAYYPEFQRDVFGINENKVFVNSHRARKSREERARTSGPEKRIILTDIGSFDLALTARSAAAWMRVTMPVRKGVQHIQFGTLSINMSNMQVKCGMYDCKFHRQLRLTPLSDGPLSDGFDREFSEYQLLAMLEHLGEHGHRYPLPNFPKFTEPAKRYRDDTQQKLESRAVTLINQFNR